MRARADAPTLDREMRRLWQGLAFLVLVAADEQCQDDSSLDLHSTWETLDNFKRAELYLQSAAAGTLGEELTSCAKLIEVDTFDEGGNLIRGAAAATDLSPSVVCTIGEGAVLDMSVGVRRMLSQSLGDQPELSREIASFESLVLNPSEERSLLTLILMREAGRQRSPLMPYFRAFLEGAHEHNPASWDPASADGAARRQALAEQTGGHALLKGGDMLRSAVADFYAALVPRALAELPLLLLGDGVDAAEYYSLQRFTEVWLSIRSRSFDDGNFGVIVPLACLLNHPSDNGDSNVVLSYSAQRRGFDMTVTRPIKRGEQLTNSYGAGLCRERALLVYGFVTDIMPPCY